MHILYASQALENCAVWLQHVFTLKFIKRVITLLTTVCHHFQTAKDYKTKVILCRGVSILIFLHKHHFVLGSISHFIK